MMRLLTTIMLLALLVFGLWSWVDYDYWLLGPSPAHYTWWWPEEFSTIGQDIVFLDPLRSVGAHLNHVNALKSKISQPIFDGKKAEFFFALANVLIIIHGK